MYKYFLAIIIIVTSIELQAQTNTLDYLNFHGNSSRGIRFWSHDAYKISMGNSAEYRYGPVQDFSIKSNMHRTVTILNRGWTWGSLGETPVAALRTDGTLQIKKDFITEGRIGVGNNNPKVDLHIFNSNLSQSQSSIRSSLRLESKIYGNHVSHDLVSTDGVFYLLKGQNQNPLFDHSFNTMNKILRLNTGELSLFNVGDNSNEPMFTIKSTLIDYNDNFRVKSNGYVYARRVEVIGSGNFPDYVFDTDYDLRTLSEVESYIKANHHLPDVPSAKEIEENGHNLGQMDEILLKKVEELTLYMIELKKENEELKKRLEKIEKNEK